MPQELTLITAGLVFIPRSSQPATIGCSGWLLLRATPKPSEMRRPNGWPMYERISWGRIL